MKPITARTGDGPRLHFDIMDYFQEAFGFQQVRVGFETDYNPDERHAYFNRDLVPEMVQRLEGWRHEFDEGAWVEGLSVRSLADHVDRLKNAHFEELDRVWDRLSDKEKLFIIRKIAQKDQFWDAMNALAALAERLQARVLELEERLSRERLKT